MTSHDDDPIRISEMFRTYQGEGRYRGRRSVFLRTSGCNFDCGWCDTPYTWDWERYDRQAETHTWTVAHCRRILDGLRRHGDGLTVTGGEPALQTTALRAVIAPIRHTFAFMEVETNGSQPPHRNDTFWLMADQINLSVKLANSGVDEERRLAHLPGWRRWIADRDVPNVSFKPVVEALDDYDEVEDIRKRLGLEPWQVIVMPQGQDRAPMMARAEELVDGALARGYEFTLRDHVLLWPGQRGR